jgi:hypothetical protein
MQEKRSPAGPGTRMAKPPRTPRLENQGNCRPGAVSRATHRGTPVESRTGSFGGDSEKVGIGRSWSILFSVFLTVGKGRFPVHIGRLSGQGQMICQETMGYPWPSGHERGICRKTDGCHQSNVPILTLRQIGRIIKMVIEKIIYYAINIFTYFYVFK